MAMATAWRTTVGAAGRACGAPMTRTARRADLAAMSTAAVVQAMMSSPTMPPGFSYASTSGGGGGGGDDDGYGGPVDPATLQPKKPSAALLRHLRCAGRRDRRRICALRQEFGPAA